VTFDVAWAKGARLLEPALIHAGHTHSLGDVARLVRSGAAQLWSAANSAAVTLIEDDPQERRLLIWLAGGDLGELTEEVLPRMEQWARARGCRRVLVVGRPGWERALRPKGFAPLARLIAKEL